MDSEQITKFESSPAAAQAEVVALRNKLNDWIVLVEAVQTLQQIRPGAGGLLVESRGLLARTSSYAHLAVVPRKELEGLKRNAEKTDGQRKELGAMIDSARKATTCTESP